MKNILLLCAVIAQTTKAPIAKRISKTATIHIAGRIEEVFPLFGAFEERKWADGWDPEILYPAEEKIEEGTTFRTKRHGKPGKYNLWVVTKYQLNDYLIQYLVTAGNRFWTITVKCRPFGQQTAVDITYAFTGLTAAGNKENGHTLQTMYQHNLKDWEHDINRYLTTLK